MESNEIIEIERGVSEMFVANDSSADGRTAAG